MNKEEFYEDILNTYNKYGYINRKLLVESIKSYNVGWQLSKYNGLKNICDELGIDYTQASKIPSKQIEDDFLRVYNEQGEISTEIYERYGKYGISTIKAHFGGLNNLMKKLNIPINCTRMDEQEDVKKDFESFYKKYKTTSSTVYRLHGKYSQSVIERLFGSWSEFIKSMGLDVKCEKFGKEYMIQKVRILFEEYGFLSAKLINDNCEFTYQALSNHYSLDEISRFVGSENAFLKFESSGAKMLYKVLSSIYGEDNIIKEYTTEWLINPKTGKRLYVDFYLKGYDIAIEYDGEQHYKFVKFIHKKYKDFYNQVYRDRTKEKILLKHGIKTVRFKFDENITESHIKEKISNV